MPSSGIFQEVTTTVSKTVETPTRPTPENELEFVSNKRPDLIAREGMNNWCGVTDCNQPQWHKMPLCESHAFDIWHEVGMYRMDLHQAGGAVIRRQAVEKIKNELVKERMGVEKFMAERKQTPGVIYYLQVADQIKIGYTADLPTRMKAYPPMAELLATHPGTRETERQMHQKFAVKRAARNEWFHPHDKLTEHIELVRTQFSQERP